MISEALEFLTQQAKATVEAKHKIEVIQLPGEDKSKFAIVKPNGELEPMVARPAPAQSVLLSVEEVPDYCAWLIGSGGAKPTVWYDQTGVRIVHDDRPFDREQDRTFVPLVFSEPMRRIYNLVKEPGAQAFTQRELVRLLRVELYGCLGDAGQEFLRTVRFLDFKSFVSGHSDVGHGRQSLGKEIEQEVTARNGSPIPEEIAFGIPIYTDRRLREHRQIIRLAVEIEPQVQKFLLAPLAGEVENAIDRELQDVLKLISPSPDDEEPPYHVFYGSP